MPVTKSPLRYPGGKTQLAKFLERVIEINSIENVTYCEPFAGGAGAAIELLLTNKVSRLILNDFDIGIYSIWNAILNQTEIFINKILETEVTIDEWHNQKDIYIKLKEKGKYSIE